ncbi:MAG: RagB/SusD family nutrient uptake outer membrane protein [Prevotellaceae bacterium]|nr:RagB/SusD family nutrient uptake outer membrane protein [Prevotellaceae bacterium]
MKKKSIIGMLSLSLLVGVSSTSCEDMLSVDTGDKTYVNANDTLYSYWGIMKSVQDIAERYVILGEVRGDLVVPTSYTTDTLFSIANFEDPKDGSCSMLNIRDYYNVINNCNLYIHNADTSQIKSNIKYMLPEYAQVQAIRAWTYLQLVQNYGEVPFISDPISSLDVIKNFDYNANLVNKDNLVDRLLDLGLTKYIDTDYPNYGDYNNGATGIAASLSFIPVRLVLGDLYLLRGKDVNDYKTAAQYYYDYLKTTSSYVPRDYVGANKSRLSSTGFTASYGSMSGARWGSYSGVYMKTLLGEVITSIPSSANKQFGTMLTRVSDIFGYMTTSSQSTDVGTDDNGEEEVSTSGAISVIPTYNKIQFTPSDAYKGLSDEQTYVHYTHIGTPKREDYTCGDARIMASMADVTYEGVAYTLCSKAASGNTFYYTIPTYRKCYVWLKLAEAINRAGFPQHAFAILKDGLNKANTPSIVSVMHVENVLDENGDQKYDEAGNALKDTTYTREMKYNAQGALYYVDSLEYKSFFLDFADDVWSMNYGIHARGCGYGSWAYEESPITNITGLNDSTAYAYDVLLAAQNVDAKTASKDEVINAVENIIIDELALETSFEGNRFTDLVRVANHKNAAGQKGTEWLANKVASRGVRTDKEDHTVIIGTRDEAIYSKLLDTKNWYLTKPEWKVK